ncbi:MAG: molecular chaperone TorD family protein [Planctomycetes bacterium]|nr:molecular chaperone TorD family protein [Planctomycetota bacterium]
MSTRSPMLWSDALRESARWRLLGLLFERPRTGWQEELESLAAEVDSKDLRVAASAASGSGEGFVLAFIGPGGPVSPREIAYRQARDPGHILAQLAAAYRAFAFTPQREDPLDHVAVEVGFVAYLRMKQAFAAVHGDQDSAALAAEAAERFMAEHLAAFAPQLAARLEECAAGHLHLAARALADRAPHFEDSAPASNVACVESAGCAFTCGGESHE